MAGYDKDEVPMLSDTHPQYSDDNVQLKLDKFMSRTRSASVSIPMSSMDSSYEGKPRLVGHTGPLRSQSKTLFVPMSGPLYANRRPDSIFRPVQAPTAGQEAVEPAGEKFPSTNATTENEWAGENYLGKNEHLLRSGQLGLCNDPYCTTCPTFNLKAAQAKHRRASALGWQMLSPAHFSLVHSWNQLLPNNSTNLRPPPYPIESSLSLHTRCCISSSSPSSSLLLLLLLLSRLFSNQKMAKLPSPEPFLETRRETDAGAVFVLQSKGQWWHAGFHLTTAIVGPTILTLPYAFRGLGWGPGFLCLTIMGLVTFYSYYLMSMVLDHCEREGRRHIRFRELAADVLGSGWMYYFVIFVQTAINTGVGIGAILLSGECLKIMYSELSPNGSLKLYHFIAMVTVVMIVISQLPTFHSLRHINFVSLLLSLGYSFLVVGACVYAGASKNPPARDYSLESSTSTRLFSAFTSISIFAAIFGNGILPEIQATLAPPATGKMVKGLMMCYAVIFITFYSTAVSGYWVFGNKSSSNILNSLMPDEGPSLAPTWVLGLTVIFVLLQLLAIGLVYSQVAYEIMEQKSADVKQGMFSKRNLIPRIILRSLYMALCGFFAAMLPFFGDISGVVGAVGFIPLDFILPMLLYNKTYKPAKSTFTYWMNISIIIVFTGAGLLGTFSSVRKLVLDANRFKLFSDDVVD